MIGAVVQIDKRVAVIDAQRDTWRRAIALCLDRAGELFVEGRDEGAHVARDLASRMKERLDEVETALSKELEEQFQARKSIT